MCQGFSDFSGFLHYFVLAKIATSSMRVKQPKEQTPRKSGECQIHDTFQDSDWWTVIQVVARTKHRRL